MSGPAADYGTLFGMVGIVAAVVALFLRLIGKPEPRRISPQPLRVKEEPDLVAAPDCHRRYQEVNARIEAVERRSDKSNEAMRQDMGEMRDSARDMEKQLLSLVKVTYKVAGKLGIVVEEGIG